MGLDDDAKGARVALVDEILLAEGLEASTHVLVADAGIVEERDGIRALGLGAFVPGSLPEGCGEVAEEEIQGLVAT